MSSLSQSNQRNYDFLQRLRSAGLAGASVRTPPRSSCRSNCPDSLFQILVADPSDEVRGLSVSRFPGFPGSCGDQDYYYVADLGGGDYTEPGAHRHWFRTEEQTETHYHRIIEQIIPTIERLPQ